MSDIRKDQYAMFQKELYCCVSGRLKTIRKVVCARMQKIEIERQDDDPRMGSIGEAVLSGNDEFLPVDELQLLSAKEGIEECNIMTREAEAIWDSELLESGFFATIGSSKAKRRS